MHIHLFQSLLRANILRIHIFPHFFPFYRYLIRLENEEPVLPLKLVFKYLFLNTFFVPFTLQISNSLSVASMTGDKGVVNIISGSSDFYCSF